MSLVEDKKLISQHTWNKMATLYEEKFLPLRMYDHTYDALLSSLPAGAKILDWGCGPGIISTYVRSKRSDIRIIGIDNAPNMIARAQANIPDGIFTCTDLKDADFTNIKFDAIFGGFVLPYLSSNELDVYWQKINVITSPNAVLYLSFVAGEEEQSCWKSNHEGDRVFFNYHDPEQLVHSLSAFGWQCEQSFEVPYDKEFHTVMIFRKANKQP